MPRGKEVIEIKPELEPVSPTDVGIYTSPTKGEPMLRRGTVTAYAGMGLEGDRYMVGVEKGTYSIHRIPEEWRNITIISQQGIEEARAKLHAQNKAGFNDSETRRNVVVGGITPDDLNALVEGNKSIWLGEVEVRVMSSAPPCNAPSEQYGKPGFRSVFEGRGGVRGRIVNTGEISELSLAAFQPPVKVPVR